MNKIEESSHAIMAPSAAHRWLPCTASIGFIAEHNLVSKTSTYANEGSAAHSCGEDCVRFGIEPEALRGQTYEVGGEKFEVDDEMVEAIKVYVDFVNAIAPVQKRKTGEVKLHIEAKLDIGEGITGTADCVAYYPERRNLVVADYKHGSGVVVEPAENPQLMLYAFGALQKIEREGGNVEHVRIVVVQPRAPHPSGEKVREWWTTAGALRSWWSTKVAPAIRTIKNGGGVFKAGEHCRFCSALPVCEAHQERALEIARTEFGVNNFPKPASLEPAHIAKVLEFSELMATWVQEVKAYAQGQMQSGVELPGYKLVAKRAVRKWKDEAEATKKLVELLADAAYEKKFLSVAKAEKALESRVKKAKKSAASLEKEGGDPKEIEALKNSAKAFSEGLEAFAELWEKPDNGCVIAHESDPRKAIAAPALADFVKELDMFK